MISFSTREEVLSKVPQILLLGRRDLGTEFVSNHGSKDSEFVRFQGEISKQAREFTGCALVIVNLFHNQIQDRLPQRQERNEVSRSTRRRCISKFMVPTVYRVCLLD